MPFGGLLIGGGGLQKSFFAKLKDKFSKKDSSSKEEYEEGEYEEEYEYEEVEE